VSSQRPRLIPPSAPIANQSAIRRYAYLAPEIIDNRTDGAIVVGVCVICVSFSKQHADNQRTLTHDVFAFGVLLFELCTLREPMQQRRHVRAYLSFVCPKLC
jgi:hypothetical protein